MCAATLAMLVAVTSRAAGESFTDLSLTELMNEPVTTVSKKATRLGDAPTAITVITADDIRLSGMTSIPELLRLVPGFDVARIDASHWAISSRGSKVSRRGRQRVGRDKGRRCVSLEYWTCVRNAPVTCRCSQRMRLRMI